MSLAAPAPIVWLGSRAIAGLGTVAEVLGLLYGAAIATPFLVRGRGARVLWQVTLEQLRYTGVQAIPIIGLVSLALGTLILTQANAYVPAEYVPTVAATILVREVIPLVVAMVLIGRSATAISVELASMRLSGQIHALRAMGMAIEHVIVLPRLIAGVVSAVCLAVLGLTIALVAGYGVARMIAPMPFPIGTVLAAVQLDDAALALVKVLLFGAGVALVAIREGLAVRVSAAEIPRAATRAPVRGVGLCVVLNSLLSLLA
jgi:phospholipid/cholesterol/gamma-HCH transport system permease protein